MSRRIGVAAHRMRDEHAEWLLEEVAAFEQAVDTFSEKLRLLLHVPELGDGSG